MKEDSLTPVHNLHISGTPQCDKSEILSHCSASSAAKSKILPLRPSMSANYASGSATRLVDFHGRDFVITSDVLIPRPETEMVVDAVLSLCGKSYLPGVKPSVPKLPQDCSILDVGTGSGCIAITLKLELPESAITACDISKKALAIARKNAHRLKAKMEFVESDLIGSVDGDYDIIVANLPYVDENWDWIDKEALSVEPSLALYAEDGGLALIKRLIGQVSECKIPYLILEADPCQHERVIEYTGTHNYQLLETRGFCLVFENREYYNLVA